MSPEHFLTVKCQSRAVVAYHFVGDKGVVVDKAGTDLEIRDADQTTITYILVWVFYVAAARQHLTGKELKGVLERL